MVPDPKSEVEDKGEEDKEILSVLKELEIIKAEMDKGKKQKDVARAISTCQETVASTYFEKDYDWKQNIKC
ncbi:hypothetical protein [Saliterribacillus persicus]|uniref:Uncharacterized protein n=1 Tax=Saliterribacillus persicus TaxID=930114 RepID=A0A368XRP1_9BACI|nr:hypothetical protein [Saliterribacillus persicus]RCW69708.1 hypothetical protein DFR57_10796 [Saliterribacillus persicus]